jgi:uncharacterized protein (DUF1015 family)
VVHRLWIVNDVKTISELAGAMSPKPVYIADGHHRYETACNYLDELSAAGPIDRNHPANFVLMMCVSMNDSGMIVLPTHRLFRGLPELDSGELVAHLGDCFSTRVAGEGSDLAEMLWESIEVEGAQGTLGLYTAKDERWVLARITDAGRAKMAEIASEHSPDWQQLGVSILHRLVIETLLGATNLPKPDYVHLVREVIDGLDNGSEQGERYPLAALVMPASLDHIKAISQHGERMPAKSTYFYPKLLSGLVINPVA